MNPFTMDDTNQDIPFFWRLNPRDDGWCMVSLVVPVQREGSDSEHEIPTSIVCMLDENPEQAEDTFEWSEEDVQLFVRLIGRQRAQGKGVMRVDLSDPATMEAVQVVAAASFGAVFDGEDYLVRAETSLPSQECEVGSQVSIHTVAGFKPCVVVEEDDENVVCVLLDKVDSGAPGFIDDINPYDLMLLKRHQVLHSLYSSQEPGKSDTLH